LGWAGARTAALVSGRYAVCFLDSASLRVDAVGRLGKPVRDPGRTFGTTMSGSAALRGRARRGLGAAPSRGDQLRGRSSSYRLGFGARGHAGVARRPASVGWRRVGEGDRLPASVLRAEATTRPTTRLFQSIPVTRMRCRVQHAACACGVWTRLGVRVVRGRRPRRRRRG
jgi:hypothetical protein